MNDEGTNGPAVGGPETGEPAAPGHARRRFFEASAWLLTIAFFWTVDTLTQRDLLYRAGRPIDDFRLITEQVTSALAVFLMVGFVAFWLRHFPLDRERLLPTLVGHGVGSLLFTLGHYFLFVGFRTGIFALRGLDYMPDQKHFGNLVFEYKKDLKIYLAIVFVLAIYRAWRERGEVSPVDPGSGLPSPSESAKNGPSPEDCLVVQTRHGDRRVELGVIDYLEAARNYVEVHVGERKYLVRSTLAALEKRLPEDLFVRCHRSYLVRASRVVEVRSRGSAHALVLSTGAEVPLSRAYREAWKVRIREREVGRARRPSGDSEKKSLQVE